MIISFAFAVAAEPLLVSETDGETTMSEAGVSVSEQPEAYVTKAEFMAITERLVKLYDGNPDELSEVENGDELVTRAFVVKTLYEAIESNDDFDKTAKNEVLAMIDVENGSENYKSAKSFLEWGIIEGTSEYACFGGDSLVMRYELALIVDRLLRPEERISAKYVLYGTNEPFYLIEDNIINTGVGGLNDGGSGWRIDYTGSYERGVKNTFNDTLDDYAREDCMSMSRWFQTQDKGIVMFEAIYKFVAGEDLEFQFLNSDEDVAFRFGWYGRMAFIGDVISEEISADSIIESDKTVRMKVEIDLTNNKIDLYAADKYVGSTSISDDVKKNICKINIVTATVHNENPLYVLGSFDFDQFYLYKSYLANDAFRADKIGATPRGYVVSNGTATVEKCQATDLGFGDTYSLRLSPNAVVERKLDFTCSENTAYTAYFIAYDGVRVSAMTKGYALMSVEARDGVLYYGENALTTYTDGVWQQVRFEIDAKSKTGSIKINGKSFEDENGNVIVYNLPKFKGVDGIRIIAGDEGTFADDLRVWKLYSYEDYVPTPSVLDTGSYTLSMSICNLWRNGNHFGWDYIDPYEEIRPITGYYDEGSPEAMDWEIKFLVEHGVTNYALCWYPTNNGSSANAALKTPRIMGEALHEGFFNAKYSDLMTFNLMFENTGYTASSLEDFKEHVFPMWIDWYFKDDRYLLTNDGTRVVLTVYNFVNWMNMAGDECARADATGNYEYQWTEGAPASQELLAWMNEQIKNAGIYRDGKQITGVMLNFGGAFNIESAYKAMKAAGGENMTIYTWGKNLNIASDLETQKEYATNHQQTALSAGIYFTAVATISFNDIAWADVRTNVMSPEDFEELLIFYRDSYIENTNNASGLVDFIQFATWNEFGEGHYFYPAETHTVTNVVSYNDDGSANRVSFEVNPFDYLDVIAKIFGSDYDTHHAQENQETLHVIPTDEQKARIGNLYVTDGRHKIVRDFLVDDIEAPVDILAAFDFRSDGNAGDASFAETNSDGDQYFKNLVSGLAALFGQKKYSTIDTEYNATFCETNVENARIKLSTYAIPGLSYDEFGEVLTNENGDKIKNDILLSDIDFIFLKYGIQETDEVSESGAGNGKFYFSVNYPEGTGRVYQGEEYYDESYGQYFEFEAPIGAEGAEIIIDPTTNAKWKEYMGMGAYLNSVSFVPTDMADRAVYLYDIRVCQGDPDQNRTQIIVDNHEYNLSSWGEILGETREEIYIAPAHHGGLYQLLHIVYDWDGTTLKLEAPDGSKMIFTVGSDMVELIPAEGATASRRTEQIPIAAYSVGDGDGTFSTYDGVPVIPLFYVLNKMNIKYIHDFDNEKLDIYVTSHIGFDSGIYFGNAEDTINALLPDSNPSFRSWSQAYSLEVAEDPENSINHAYMNPVGDDSAICLMTFDASRTYTLYYDYYLAGFVEKGATDRTNLTTDIDLQANNVRFYAYPRYSYSYINSDGEKKWTYVGSAPTDSYKAITEYNTWVHESYTFTVSDTLAQPEDQEEMDAVGALDISKRIAFGTGYFSIDGVTYCPVFYLDDVVLIKHELELPVENGNAEGSNADAFHVPSGSSDYFTHSIEVEELEDGTVNHYWKLTPAEGITSKWAYIVQEMEFEPGATYYFRLRAKVDTDSYGNDITDHKIQYNFRFFDIALHVEGHNECAHHDNLRGADNSVLTFDTGDDWQYAYGSFTVGMDYDKDACRSEITFYADPVRDADGNYVQSVGYMLDDIVFSTRPLSVVE